MHRATKMKVAIFISDQSENSLTILKDLMKQTGQLNLAKIHHNGNKVIPDY